MQELQSNKMNRSPLWICACVIAVVSSALSQPVHAQRMVAITGATIETATKEGAIDDATLLIKDGKIEAIGTDVEIPVAAQIVDAAGKTILPGIVDPYYVVTIGRNTQASTQRTIVFRGRVFVIGGGAPAIATTFAKVVDGLDSSKVDWTPAIRSGVTSFHVVTGGYAQSLLARPNGPGHDGEVAISKPDANVLVTVSNDTKSLDVLRKNLKPASTSSSSRSSAQRPVSTSGGRPSAEAIRAAMAARAAAAASSSPTAKLWASVRDGKMPVFVNVNNASAILHADAILDEYPKAKVALVASGPNVYSTLASLEPKRYTVILPPAIDRRPNSADRINMPRMLSEKKIGFALSLSLGQSDFRVNQPTPLFGVGMLIRAGLNRQDAIKALTIEPAKLIGMDKEVGSLEVGKKADLLVFGEDPFSATAEIEQIYVSGELVNE